VKYLRKLPIDLKLIVTMLATSLVVLTVIAFVMRYSTDRNTELAGLTTARAVANQIVALRSFYTTHVVAPARSAGVQINYDFREKEKTIPLPATMVKALGDDISRQFPGTSIRLYSDYPFPHRKSTEQYDAFERAAIDALELDPTQPFYRLEDLSDRKTIRYAVADVMQKSCVDCHNTHPESPKTDWKVGDLRGVVEVNVPVDDAESQLQAGSWMQGLVVAVGFLLLIGLTGSVVRRITSTLKAAISTVATTSDSIATTVKSHGRIASDQATAMHETSATMELLGKSAQTSAQQAATSASETDLSLSLAEEGSVAVQQSQNAMSDLKDNVSALAEEIVALSERVEQIGEISSFVGDLAGQTNMLALNAAVEAAHAGEHGKGFAVVATEIRKLADQSTKSVARINDLVAHIQGATNSAVMSTEQGTKVVNRTIELAEQTSDVFENLRGAINRASESVQQISLNANEQSAGIGQMADAIESLNEGAQQAASGLNQTGEGLESLNHVVENLQHMVGMTNAHRGR